MKKWNRVERGFFWAFLIWSAAGLLFTLLRITPASIGHWPVPGWLREFVQLCLNNGDPILILLAFANTHLQAARQWTPAVARRWALIVLTASLLVETLGAWTGFPFGAYRYTNQFGPLLGIVPLAIPLAWHVVVTIALFTVRAARPFLSRSIEALMVGFICTIYDFILEPFATDVKHYWIWSGGGIPPQNYLAWFVLSSALAWFFAPSMATRYIREPRPGWILAVMVLIFVAGRWVG